MSNSMAAAVLAAAALKKADLPPDADPAAEALKVYRRIRLAIDRFENSPRVAGEREGPSEVTSRTSYS